ncbi:MAG: General secretion pathway protein D / Type II secretion outermembrane pore forming protein (PulD) [uncultured Ramlibacter sp.]|uniref:General secretion pathway protein D / Type II secretion outermembrane pore forming protein (PulD) n=1 Tax=uncultured Ramlibacter sp. TaxID=260755 RepID=A0A6J4Q4T0_9BURK|nr:MAG: General secretion pathway protein D / Type II secretion outermembrane pore forming protein (PulD) [uncultured Ramlibacter sp.]
MKFRRALVSLLAGAALAAAGSAHAQRAREPVTLNFANAEIEAVARTMAAITGRNIVVDPRVKGTISLSTERPVPPQTAFNQFVSTLRLSGFTVVESGGLYKVVPEADAKLQGGAVSVGPPQGGAQIQTQIFRLNYETANNLVPILRPLISPNNTINVNPGNNSLVITDYADNLQRIGRIISALDVSNATDVEVITLKHALASDLAPVVQRLVDTGGATPVAAQGQSDTSFRTTVIPEARSNALIVRAANPARMNLVRSLVQRLDQPGSQNPTGNIYVVYLKNADAVRLATTLRAAMAGMGTSGSQGLTGAPILAGGGGMANTMATGTAPGGAGATGANPAATAAQPLGQPSTGGQIQADQATNSLIITAPEPQYRQLRAVIDSLDSRRAQVYVESLIVEVNADKAAEFGVQWQNIFGNRNDRNIPFAGTNFGTGGANIIGLQSGAASGQAVPSPGFNIGLVRNISGTFVLGALARFLESNADGNILSTPNLLTLDNEEARIVIGQNVPFVTGQFTNTGASNGSVNPFQTIERKDVGLTLRVRPQINENGTVKMQIFQEVSSVQASSINSATGLITNKRSIESNVLVDDGAVVVLGGLLQDEYSGNQEKVPGLGDVPLVGNLFRSEARSRRKTNLMVFLRPIVVRDAVQSDELSLDRYDLMRLKQEAAQPQSSIVVPINSGPVLPVQTPRPPPPAAAPAGPPLPAEALPPR